MMTAFLIDEFVIPERRYLQESLVLSFHRWTSRCIDQVDLNSAER